MVINTFEGIINTYMLSRPMCKECNRHFCAVNYIREGVRHYRSLCDHCGKKKKKFRRLYSWEKAGYQKKSTCDVCGFNCVYPTQMLVYHIDGDLTNVNFTNLRTICLNCVEVVKKKDFKWKRGDLQVDY